MVTRNVILKIALIQSLGHELVHGSCFFKTKERATQVSSPPVTLTTSRSRLVINVGFLLLRELGALLLEHVQQGLGALQDFVEGTLRLLDRLVVLVASRVLLRKRIIDGFKPVGK